MITIEKKVEIQKEVDKFLACINFDSPEPLLKENNRIQFDMVNIFFDGLNEEERVYFENHAKELGNKISNDLLNQ